MLTKLNRKHSNHIDSEGSWAISYGDMITVLLSFFVLFFSFDFKKDKEKILEKNTISSLSELDVKNIHNADVKDSIENMTTVIRKDEKGNILIFYKGSNFFNTAAVDINSLGADLLKDFLAKVTPYLGKFKVKIHAFTDDQPVRSNRYRYRDNLELSALRSISVLRFLNEHGMPLHRVELGGQGVMSKKILESFGFKDLSIQEIRKISRTVAFTLYRENSYE